MLRRGLFVGALMAMLAALAIAQAQERSGRREGERRQGQDQSAQDQGRRGGNLDASQMRERWMTSIKEQLTATDDEWKTLSPKIEKVMTAQRDLRTGYGGFAGRRGGGEGDAEPSKFVQAQRDLRTALEDKATPAEAITKKLADLRETRKKARADLEAAQKELKEGLSPRHEAALVLAGMLD